MGNKERTFLQEWSKKEETESPREEFGLGRSPRLTLKRKTGFHSHRAEGGGAVSPGPCNKSQVLLSRCLLISSKLDAMDLEN